MSLRCGVLGLLAGEPASGYDLARRFEEALGSIWSAEHPQIYGELTRLADEAGVRLYEALAGWAEWAQHVPPAADRPVGPSA